MQAGGIDGIAVQHKHASLYTSHQDDQHLDPFDRLLVSQAMLEKLPIISADPSLSAYEIEFIDATK